MQNEELSLEDLKKIEFDMLCHIKEFCIEQKLRYFLSNGTLLGAVKYKGFIPWDDDIDIFIPRKDYEKLIKQYTDTERYKLFSPERVEGYAFPFAKLCDMTTRRIEKNNDNGVELGVDIDIFPLDMWEQNAKWQAKKQMNRMLMLRLAKNYRITSTTPLKTLIKKSCAVFCKCLGPPLFIRQLQKCALKSTDTTENLGCVIWPVYGLREIIPSGVFADTTEVEFEGEKFLAPIGYDSYLRSLYGDYEIDPPIEKQKSHHKFMAYKCKM